VLEAIRFDFDVVEVQWRHENRLVESFHGELSTILIFYFARLGVGHSSLFALPFTVLRRNISFSRGELVGFVG